MRTFILLLLSAIVMASDPAFTIVVKTDNPGTSASNQFTLPLDEYASYYYTVDWGDGTSQTLNTSASPTHTYANVGTYTIRITAAPDFPRILFNFGGDRAKLLQIAHWGDVPWKSMARAFTGCSNLVITATDAATARTGEVWDYTDAWSNCTSLTSFPLLDTSGGSIFSGAWYNCSGLTSFPLLDTSNGLDFQYTWALCVRLTSFPALDTSAGRSFNTAWANCQALTSFPLLNTANGESFISTWSGCSGLTTFPALNLNSMTNGGSCLQNVTLSQASYNALLSRLAAGNTHTSVPFGGGLSTYDDAAVAARNTLVNTRGWTITDGGHTKPVITNLTALNVTVSMPFTYQITTTSENVPTSYAAALPAGFSVNTTTGVITGSSSTSFVGSIAISAINAGGTTTAWLPLCVSDNGAPVMSNVTRTGTIYQPFTYTIVASNSPISYNASGLPAGLVLNPTTGVIHGTPTVVGNYGPSLFRVGRNPSRKVEFGPNEVHHVNEVFHVAVSTRPTLG